MSLYTESVNPMAAAVAAPSERAQFIRRTYTHLAGALGSFIAIEYLLLNSPIAEPLVGTLLGSPYSWLIVLALFMGVSWVANRWAMSDTSPAMQYVGLSLFVVAEAIVFLPLLYIANAYYEGIILQAGILSGALFVGLTAVVFTTRQDFSFLRPALTLAGFAALGFIVASILFGFTLGTLFASGMIVFAGASILYNTSNVLHHFSPQQHVAAALSLFASVALLFFYVLRLLMSLNRN